MLTVNRILPGFYVMSSEAHVSLHVSICLCIKILDYVCRWSQDTIDRFLVLVLVVTVSV